MCGFKFYKLKKGKLYSVKAACVFDDVYSTIKNDLPTLKADF